jgi:NADH dehydrogenase
MSERHRVLIVGGGFGGLNAARSLARLPVEVTLVDRRNFHLFQPLLYQVASGGLSPGDIAAPLRHVLARNRNTRVLMADVARIDAAGRRAVLDDGASLPYDTLVLATGATHHYFGHDDWAEFAPGLKTIEDATEVRRRILDAFERAEREPDPALRRLWLRFVIVGGGPTGVELAGAISEISRDAMRGDFRTINPEESQILILDGSDRVLPSFRPELSEKAARHLIKLDVLPRNGVRVTRIDADGVDLTGPNGPERIDAKTVLWAAGVKPSPMGRALAEPLGAEVDRAGRVRVGPDLSVPGHPEVIVIGDVALFEQDGQPLVGVAPVAIQQGWHVGKVVGARLKGRTPPAFRYFDFGIMATIGRNAAVADMFGVRFAGRLAWLAWLFVHLMQLVGFQNRLVVALKWALLYATYNRGARLIGRPPP